MHRTSLTLADIRRRAITRTLFAPTSIVRAVERLGFVQADPIRAPARAQDLILRHRVAGYRAGDLEREYASLPIEECFFINYGFLPRSRYLLMQPRPTRGVWDRRDRRRTRALLEFVRSRGDVHPRQVEAHFNHGQVTNYWGGQSSATTHLLDAMHYRGLLRVARRERGIRIYAVEDEQATGRISRADTSARLDALIDLVVQTYAPVPEPSLGPLVARLRYAVPQWQHAIGAALKRARTRLTYAVVEGTTWYAPSDDATDVAEGIDDEVRLLAPFDPIVWDRRRFEWLWGWRFRFEAYTPVAKRTLGYYALPLLFRDRIVGWANVTRNGATLDTALSFAPTRPKEKAFAPGLEVEMTRLKRFLGHDAVPGD